MQKQQQSNKPNTTSRLHNTELRLRLSFVFILYLCFKVRISFWCFIKFLKKFRGNLGKKNQTFWKKNPKCSPMWIFNRKGKERERVKREEEEKSLEKCCIIIIFLQFLLSNNALVVIWGWRKKEEEEKWHFYSHLSRSCREHMCLLSN